MMPWTTVLLFAGLAMVAVVAVLAKKRRNGLAVMTGFICAALLAGAMYLSVVEKPLFYNRHQTKETYLALQSDKNVSSFRVVVDGKITNRFPEWDEEHPLSFRLLYDVGEIHITTDHAD